MRVLLTYVTIGRGGDAVQLLALAEAVRSGGHDVSLVGAYPIAPYTFDTVGGRVKNLIRALPWWVRDLLECGFDTRATWRASRVAGRQGVDVIIHRASVYDAGAAYLARRLRVPLILYLDAHVEVERAFRGERYWRGLHAKAMRALGRAADVIATPSRAVADYYIGLGLPADRIEIVRNGIGERHLRMGLEMADTHPPLAGAVADAGQYTLGFVGSLSRWHGVDLLLDALRILREGRPAGGNPRLVIVGRGTEEDALKARARSLGVEGTVEWRGALSHDDAVRTIGEFDIAILPSTLPTGAPMKLSEYAAMARPIIAPDYPNIRELFAEREEILLVPPDDTGALAQAVRSLVADPPMARRIGRAAQRRVSGYTWEQAVDRLLRRLARSPRTDPP